LRQPSQDDELRFCPESLAHRLHGVQRPAEHRRRLTRRQVIPGDQLKLGAGPLESIPSRLLQTLSLLGVLTGQVLVIRLRLSFSADIAPAVVVPVAGPAVLERLVLSCACRCGLLLPIRIRLSARCAAAPVNIDSPGSVNSRFHLISVRNGVANEAPDCLVLLAPLHQLALWHSGLPGCHRNLGTTGNRFRDLGGQGSALLLAHPVIVPREREVSPWTCPHCSATTRN
jgi:hypothetical protein